jgi:AcrR family transcriptional regulator
VPKISAERMEQTRRRLVDAAIQVMSNGQGGVVTTRRILEAAGLSAGALYHYFDSKDALYDAVADRFAESDSSLVQLSSGADATEAVRHHAHLFAGLFRSGRRDTLLSQLRVAAFGSASLRERLARYDGSVVGRLAATNRVTQQLGIFRTDVDPEAVAEVLEMFWEAYLLRDATGGFVAGRERVLAAFVDMMGHGVLDPTSDDATVLADLLRAGVAGPA